MKNHERILKRELGYSKIWIKNYNIPGYLRDLNELGIKLDIPVDLYIKEGESLSLVVIPEESIKIPSFELTAEVRWYKKDYPFSSLGVKINPIPDPIYRDSYHKLISYYEEMEEE